MNLTKQTDLNKLCSSLFSNISANIAGLTASVFAENDRTEIRWDFQDSCHLPFFVVLLINISVFRLGFDWQFHVQALV